MDWTVGAAIITLMQVAREEPSAVPDIAALYCELLDALPEPGSIPYLDVLLTCALLSHFADRSEVEVSKTIGIL